MKSTKTKVVSQVYPETSGVPGIPGDLSGKLGLCFSGGGSRSISASMGILRALDHIGMLENKTISCISGVSGGGWASVLYTYRSDKIDNETFLGKVVQKPGKLSWFGWCKKDKSSVLSYLNENSLGAVPTRIGAIPFIAKAIELYSYYGYPLKDLWLRVVGEKVLTPFGLNDLDSNGNPARFMGYTSDWVQNNPVKFNPEIYSETDFLTVPDDPKRPYMIVNSAVVMDKVNYFPFELSSAYGGIYNKNIFKQQLLGGGYLDSFTFGSRAPEAAGRGKNEVKVEQMATRYCLADATGLTGAVMAPIVETILRESEGDFDSLVRKLQKEHKHEKHLLRGELLDDRKSLESALKELVAAIEKEYPHAPFHEANPFPGLGSLVQKFHYWPVTEANPPVKEEIFSDGGALENMAIMPLLSRNCSRVIACVNTDIPLTETPEGLMVDPSLPPLFGYLPKVKGKPYMKYSEVTPRQAWVDSEGLDSNLFRYNQVFESDQLFVLLDGLRKKSTGAGSKLGQKPVVFRQELTTLANEKFGVKAGNKVSVLWVYNNPVKAWESKLSCFVRTMMCLDPLKYGDFPNYNTVTKFHLDARQVNLLANLACWVVLQEKDLFCGMRD